MKYNQAGIAFMPKAPKTAEATAITILRSLSHQFDFVAIRFKLRVRLKTMIRACPNAVPHKKGKRDKKKSGKSGRSRKHASQTIFRTIFRQALRLIPKISRKPTIRADSPLRRYCRRYHRKNCRPQACPARKPHLPGCGWQPYCRSQASAPCRAQSGYSLWRYSSPCSLPTSPHPDSGTSCEACRAGSLHLVAVGKVRLNLFHKSLYHVLHIAFCHGAVLLNTGGEDIDIHRSTRFGFLTEIIQHGRAFIAHDSTTLKAFYKYIHKNKV